MKCINGNKTILYSLILGMLLSGCAGLLGPHVKAGLEMSASGDFKGALAHYENIIQSGSANAKVYRLAYESAFRSGKRITAKKYFDEAIKAGYDSDSLTNLASELWYERALMTMGQNAWEEAAKAAEMIQELAPDSNPDKFCTLILAGKKKYERGAHKGLWDAISDYSNAANYDPSSGLPYFLMGQARYKNARDDYDAALEDYYNSLKVEPQGYFASQALEDIKKIEAVKKKMNAFWGK